jgi:uncharacterized protein YlxP (DUF503 family)
MHVLAILLEIRFPGCQSLKQKRSRLKPLLHGLHREFNVSAAEIDQHDDHRLSSIACVIVSNENPHAERVLSKIPDWIETRWPDVQIIDSNIMVR